MINFQRKSIFNSNSLFYNIKNYNINISSNPNILFLVKNNYETLNEVKSISNSITENGGEIWYETFTKASI